MDNVTRLLYCPNEVGATKAAGGIKGWRLSTMQPTAESLGISLPNSGENAKKTLRQLSSQNITFSSTCSIPMRTFHGITNEVIFSVSSRKFPDFPGQWEAAANDIKNAESKLTMKIHIATTICRKKSLDNTRVMYSDIASIWRWTGVGYALPSKRFL